MVFLEPGLRETSLSCDAGTHKHTALTLAIAKEELRELTATLKRSTLFLFTARW